MADGTKIEWADASWNPIRGCTRISEGCRNCYAEDMAARPAYPILRVVPPSPAAYCMPWHARGWSDEPEHGATCCFCRASIAAPESVAGLTVACIYCGLDRGEIEAVEVEP